ncbi:unnamed protein product [Ixodes pacificus]
MGISEGVHELLQVLNRHPPFGSQVLQAARSLPKYRLQIVQEGSPSNDVATVQLSVEVGCLGESVAEPGSGRLSLAPAYLLVGDADDRLLLHQCISSDGVSLPWPAPAAARKVEPPGGISWSLQDGSEAADKPKVTGVSERPRGLQRDVALDRQTRDNVDMRPSDPGPQQTPQAHPPVAWPHDAVSSARFAAGASAAKRPCLAVAEGRSDVRPWQQVPDFEAVSAALRSRYFPRRSCQPSGP